jgi:hypothetical protein
MNRNITYTKKLHPNPDEKFIFDILRINEPVSTQEYTHALGFGPSIEGYVITGRFIRKYFKKNLRL